MSPRLALEAAAGLASAVTALCIFTGAVLAALRRPLGRPLPDYPAVTLIKPVKDLDPGARENFEAFLRQDYPGPLEFLFVVESDSDPAHALLLEICSGDPAGRARLLVAGIAPRGSQKLHNLAFAESHASHPILCVSDSDVRPAGETLRLLVEELETTGCAAVCATVFYVEARSPGARALQAFANTDLAGILAVQERLGRYDTLIGGMHVLRRAALHAVGGYASLAGHISDDGALGMRLFGRGLRVLGSPVPAPMIHPRASLGEFLEIGHRWWLMMRVSAPRRFLLGPVLAAPLYGMLLFAFETVHGGAGPLAWFSGPGLCGLHVVSAAFVGRVRGPRGMGLGYAWLRPVVDAAGVFFWMAALVWPVIRWRGHRYRVAPDGQAVRI